MHDPTEIDLICPIFLSGVVFPYWLLNEDACGVTWITAGSVEDNRD